MAQRARCKERRQLLLVLAGIVENGSAVMQSPPTILPRITTQRVRAFLQPRRSTPAAECLRGGDSTGKN